MCICVSSENNKLLLVLSHNIYGLPPFPAPVPVPVKKVFVLNAGFPDVTVPFLVITDCNVSVSAEI